MKTDGVPRVCCAMWTPVDCSSMPTTLAIVKTLLSRPYDRSPGYGKREEMKAIGVSGLIFKLYCFSIKPPEIGARGKRKGKKVQKEMPSNRIELLTFASLDIAGTILVRRSNQLS